MWGDCRVRRRIRWHPARVDGAGFRGCGVPRVEMPGLGGVGVVSEHGQGGGFSRDTGARICPCSPPPLGGGCCWWWCGFRGCWLQSAVLALCIHCRVLSVQGGWFFFLLPRGKRKGRRAPGGGVMRCERYVGAAGGTSWPRYAVGSPALGGWWCVPTCQLSGFSTCRFVGKSESWRGGGVRQGGGRCERAGRGARVG